MADTKKITLDVSDNKKFKTQTVKCANEANLEISLPTGENAYLSSSLVNVSSKGNDIILDVYARPLQYCVKVTQELVSETPMRAGTFQSYYEVKRYIQYYDHTANNWSSEKVFCDYNYYNSSSYYTGDTPVAGKDPIPKEGYGIVFLNEITGEFVPDYNNTLKTENLRSWSTTAPESQLNADGTYYNYTADKSNLLGTIILKNAGKEGAINSLKLNPDAQYPDTVDLAQSFNLGDTNSTKKQTLVGNYLNQNISGGYTNDVIKTVGGNNYINAGNGADKIYLGKGEDTITLGTGNSVSPIDSHDIIYNLESEDRINLLTAWSKKDTYNSQEVKFYKKGNDLVALARDDASYQARFTRRLDFNNFFKNEEGLTLTQGSNADDTHQMQKRTYTVTKSGKITGNYCDCTPTLDEVNHKYNYNWSANASNHDETLGTLVEGKGKLKSSVKNTAFIATGKAVITTDDGDDEIYLTKNTETVNINGKGTKTIYKFNDTGNDVLNITDKDAKVYIQSDCNELSYIRKKDDLIIKMGKNASSTPNEITVKNYFSLDFVPKLYIDNTDTVSASVIDISKRAKIFDVDAEIKDNKLIIMGDLNKANNIVGVDYQDTIYGGNKNDKITVGKGKSEIHTGKGKDTIYVNKITDDTAEYYKNIYVNKGDGNTDVVFSADVSADSKVCIRFLDENNTVITNLGKQRIKDDLVIYGIFKDYTRDSVTIKNYYKNDVAQFEDNVFVYSDGMRNVLYPSDVYDGTKKADNITVNSGNALITAGKGNDTININSTSTDDTIKVYINNGDGNDTINIADAHQYAAHLFYDYNTALHYEMDGDDLIITRAYDSGKGVKFETTTITDYKTLSDSVNDVVNIKGAGLGSVDNLNAKNSGVMAYNTIYQYKKTNFSITEANELSIGTSKADKISLESASATLF